VSRPFIHNLLTSSRLYPTSDINPLVVEVEASTAKSYISSLQSEIHTLSDLRFHLLKMPVTSVEKERMFGCMKRIKTYLRTRCGDSRLSDLLVLAILYEEVKSVDVEKVIDAFSQLRSRRYPLS